MAAKFREFYELTKLDELFSESHQKPVVFFKHSITCPISRNVFTEVADVEYDIWVMVVQDAQKVSNELAKRTGIKHESPQTIIVRDGKPVYHASHYETTAEKITNILNTEKVEL